jgi:hypothetical protein
MKTYRYFTHTELTAAVTAGENTGYNRVVDPDFVKTEIMKAKLKYSRGNPVFPVTFNMIHEHIDGVNVEPHVRVMVAMSEGDTILFDVALDTFNNLSTVEV